MGTLYLTSRINLSAVIVFILVISLSLSNADYADITTIYRFQLKSNENQSKSQNDPVCQVSIYSGSTSKHLPYVIGNEIVFPKLQLKEDKTVQNNEKKVSKETSFDISRYITDPRASKNIEKEEINKYVVLGQDLDDLLNFDSNKIAKTHWKFEDRNNHLTLDKNIDTTHMGELFSKLIETKHINYILNDVAPELLAIDKLSEVTKARDKNDASNILKLSKTFEHKCEGCRFDFYKSKNGSKWDLIIIRNFEDQKESTEENFDFEDSIIKDVEPVGEKNLTSFENNATFANDSGNKISVKEQSEALEQNTDTGKSRSSRALVKTKQMTSESVVTSFRDQNDEPNNDEKTLNNEVSVPSFQKSLLYYEQDEESTEENEEPESILHTRLMQNRTYSLKVLFKTQGYFKVTFLTINPKDGDSSQIIDITVRGSCEELPSTLDASSIVVHYVDINTGSEFRTLQVSSPSAHQQQLIVMFRSEKYVQIQLGFLSHEIPLNGARLTNIELFNICMESGFNNFQFELYESVSSYLFSVSPSDFWSTISLRPLPRLTSPWLTSKNEICWTILYTNVTESYSYEYECYGDGRVPGSESPVQVKVENKAGEIKNIHDYCVETNGDIVRMIVNYRTNRTDPEEIRFIIHVAVSSDRIRYIYNNICNQDDPHIVKEVACGRTDKVAYEVAYKHNFYRKTGLVTFCGNQGNLVDGSCVCPPGFMGDHCEVACGENKFGANCSGFCTKNTTSSDVTSPSCQATLLCTHYGCVCSPGYHGVHCMQQCAPGLYGNDCKMRCGECENKTSCNIYTGHCTKCVNDFLIPPYCQESYPYVTKQPRVVFVSYFSVELEVNAKKQYLKGDLTQLNTLSNYSFHILWKDLTWNRERKSQKYQLDIGNSTSSLNIQHIWIQNLIPGHMYSFQIILFDEKLKKTHDPNKAPVTEAMTKCIIPAYEHKTRIDVTSTTAQLYWMISNVSYDHSWNTTKKEVNEIYDNETTINQLNELFNSTTKYLEVIGDLNDLNSDMLYGIFKCRKQPKYNLTVRKITKTGSKEFKFFNLNSGFTLKYLDPGKKYMVKLYAQNNDYSYEILNKVIETENVLSMIDDLEIVKIVSNNVFIRWNVDHKQTSASKNLKGTIPSGGANKTKTTELGADLSGNDFNNTKLFLSHQKPVYYIKYRIYRQRSCIKYFDHNTVVVPTTKTDYKLELSYYTTYYVFVTQNKGQTLTHKYLYVTLRENVPNISPNLLYADDVTDRSAKLAWADISLRNYECAQLNGMFLQYELVLQETGTSNGTEPVKYNTTDLYLDVDGLKSNTEYGVKLWYVNHYGKNEAVYTSLAFKTL